MDREAEIQHAMQICCDLIPYDTPNYWEVVRLFAEDYVDTMIDSSISVDDLELVCTCSACPEQYDVYLTQSAYNRLINYEEEMSYFPKDSKIPIGYIRFRWGHLTCRPCTTDGDINWDRCIYEWESDDSLEGVLPDTNRNEQLDNCKHNLILNMVSGHGNIE